MAGYRTTVGDWVTVHRHSRTSNRRWREVLAVEVLVSGSACWAMLRSHLLKLATRNVPKAAARTREGVEAAESMLPHVPDDFQRRRRR